MCCGAAGRGWQRRQCGVSRVQCAVQYVCHHDACRGRSATAVHSPSQGTIRLERACDKYCTAARTASQTQPHTRTYCTVRTAVVYGQQATTRALWRDASEPHTLARVTRAQPRRCLDTPLALAHQQATAWPSDARPPLLLHQMTCWRHASLGRHAGRVHCTVQVQYRYCSADARSSHVLYTRPQEEARREPQRGQQRLRMTHGDHDIVSARLQSTPVWSKMRDACDGICRDDADDPFKRQARTKVLARTKALACAVASNKPRGYAPLLTLLDSTVAGSTSGLLTVASKWLLSGFDHGSPAISSTCDTDTTPHRSRRAWMRVPLAVTPLRLLMAPQACTAVLAAPRCRRRRLWLRCG